MEGVSFCPACGVAATSEALFCSACSHNLSAPSVPPTSTPKPSVYPPGSIEAAMAAAPQSADYPDGVPSSAGPQEPPGEPNPFDDPELAPKPATPWAATPVGKLVTGVGGALVIGGAVWGLTGGHLPFGGDHTKTSGVTVTGGNLSPCTTPAKGYLPGAINCTGVIRVELKSPVAGDVISVFLSNTSSGNSFYHGEARLQPGQVGTVDVPVIAEYQKSCAPNLDTTIRVYAGPQSPAPTDLIAQVEITITDDCTGFPHGGL